MVNDQPTVDADLVDLVVGYIVAMCPEVAHRADHLKGEIRKEFSGIEIYIPRRSLADRQRLTGEVLSLFNGRNASEVARRLGIGRATVYRIIKQEGRRK